MGEANRVIALGFFDGVHVGHQKLLHLAAARARSLGALSSVYTFSRPPETYLTGQSLPLIFPLNARGEEIKRVGGVDEVIFAKFDQDLQQMKWRDFIAEVLIEKFRAVHVISGHNNRFGHRGEGTAEKMASECRRLGVGYDAVDDVRIDGIIVSSTYIRTLIAAGDMERAALFLGRPYSISGVVGQDRKVGRRLGFPTMNIELPPELQVPSHGVYASCLVWGDKRCPSITNIGTRPTFFEGGRPVLEQFVFGFDENVYGCFVKVELLKKIRDERAFAGEAQLKEAMRADVAAVQTFWEARAKGQDL